MSNIYRSFVSELIKIAVDEHKEHHRLLITALKQRFDEAGVPHSEAYVGGSGVMGGLGLKQIHDLDVNVGEHAYRQLSKHPDAIPTRAASTGDEQITFHTPHGDMDIGVGWNMHGLDYAKTQDNDLMLHGIRHWHPEKVMVFKKNMGREKDAPDIQAIQQWMHQNR